MKKKINNEKVEYCFTQLRVKYVILNMVRTKNGLGHMRKLLPG